MNKILSVISILFVLTSTLFSQGSILLVGGGSENYGDWSDKPYKWFVEQAPNRKILVLHYETTTNFFSGYFPSLSNCTVSNLAINSINQANDNTTYQFILEHDGIFLRGGDQAQYVAKWKGTLTEKAIKEVYQRGGVIGGTSAGEMVLSDVSYTSGSTDNGGALRNPSSSMTLVDDFLPLVSGTLAESHTNERGRLGRLPVFLAKYKSATGRSITGIAVDVNTSLAIDKNGIGQVMGGSAVSFLRWDSSTSYTIEPGKSFSLHNMKFDQLLPDYKFNLNTGEIEKPSSAIQFLPGQFSSPPGIVILDGSANPSDWAASSGSLKKLLSVLTNQNDVIGIFSSTSSPTSANTISSTLNTWGINSRILLINEDLKNDASLASSVNLCGAFIFVDNTLDKISQILNPATSVGNAFLSKVENAKPILFVSDDVMLAGEKAIGGLYTSLYSAYYGTLTQHDGLNLVRGIQFAPRFYQNQNYSRSYDYSENRIMGMFWSMAKSMLPFGVIIDAGSHITISNNMLEVGGTSATATSVILFDARKTEWVDFSTFYRPGKPNPVQNITLIGVTMNILAPGESNLLTSIKNRPAEIPSLPLLEQNYPNPFNPQTKFRISIKEISKVEMKVYDILGREAALLFKGEINTGIHEIFWNAAGFASGVYFVKLDLTNSNGLTSSSIKIVLNK